LAGSSFKISLAPYAVSCLTFHNLDGFGGRPTDAGGDILVRRCRETG
jgi:hypothetical protein